MPEIKKTVSEINKTIMKELNDNEIKAFHSRLNDIYKNIKRV